MSNQKTKKKVREAKWEFKLEIFDDGTSSFNRVNSGFSLFELLGMLEATKNDLLLQSIEERKNKK